MWLEEESALLKEPGLFRGWSGEKCAYLIPNPKHMPKYTKAKAPVPNINTHSWAALPGSTEAL